MEGQGVGIRPRRGRPIFWVALAAVVVGALLLVGLWITTGLGGGPCPTLESRVVASTPAQSLQPGLRNGSAYPFYVNSDSNRGCAAEIPDPYLSGYVTFGGCSTTLCPGNVSVFYPMDWVNASHGARATPLCWQAGTGNLTLWTQRIDAALKPYPTQSPLVLVVWSNLTSSFSAHVTFSWSQ